MVPPHRGNEDGVARFKLGHQGVFHGTFQPWETRIGRVHRRHADRRSRGREVERSYIEIAYLGGRQQGEAPAAAGHHRDVVELVEMRRRGDVVADPYPRPHGAIEEGQCIIGKQPRQHVVHRRALDRQSRCQAFLAAEGGQALQSLGDGDAVVGIVEAGHVGVVAHQAARGRIHQQGVDHPAAVQQGQVRGEGRRRFTALVHDRPVASQPAQHQRRGTADEVVRTQGVGLGDALFDGGGHGAHASRPCTPG